MPDEPVTTITPQQFAEERNARLELEGKFQASELRANQFAEQLKAKDDVIDKLVEDARVKRFSDEVYGRTPESGIRWFGDAEKHVKHLTSLAKQFGEDSEEVRYVIDTNREQAQRINATAFSVRGADIAAVVPGSAAEELSVKVKQFSEAHPDMSLSAVKAQVMADNPQLVQRERDEKAVNRG